MDIHNIPGIKILNMTENIEELFFLFLFWTIVIISISVVIIYTCIHNIIDYRDRDSLVVSIGAIFLCSLLSIGVIAATYSTYNKYPEYSIIIDGDNINKTLIENYTIISEEGEILTVIPKTDNKADKYIIEHSNK